MERILVLRQKRGQAVADARAILDNAENEKRELSQEEQNGWDGLMVEVDGFRQAIDREERQANLDREMGDTLGRDLGQSGAQHRDDDPTGKQNGEKRTQFESRSFAHLNEMTSIPAGMSRRSSVAYRTAFGKVLGYGTQGLNADDVRALQADSDPAGGYLYAPMQFVDRLIKAVDDAVFIRQWATVLPVTSGDSLGIPTLDADPADASWTSELGTGDEDLTMSFGKRELRPNPLAKRIKVSRTLVRKAPSAEALVRDRMAYKFGITWEKAAMTGSGAAQPLGVFTASANGISTARDVATGNTTTAMTFDGLISAKYSVKATYWPLSKWLFHRDGMAQVAKLKDGDGQYLWRESTRAGEPDRLLGQPAYISEYAPNTFTSGLYVGIFGDFSNYWIADSMDFTIQTLLELYAEANQIGYIARLESDGMPVLAEAFARVTLG